MNSSTSSNFMPSSLLDQVQKRITTSAYQESGDSNKNNNPTPVFRYDQDWKKSGPPPGITEVTWHSFNTLPEKEDHCAGMNKRTGSYDSSVCGIVVPGPKVWLFTISWWNKHTRSESHKKNLEWKVQAVALKLKIIHKDGSTTQFDMMQAKQMGNIKIPLKSLFVKKTL